MNEDMLKGAVIALIAVVIILFSIWGANQRLAMQCVQLGSFTVDSKNYNCSIREQPNE